MRSIVLFVFAVVSSWILLPIGLLWAIGRLLTKMRVSRAWVVLQYYLFLIALSVDQTGNVVMQELFNDVLVKDVDAEDKYGIRATIKKHRFGDPDETISSVLGKNEVQGTLTVAGKALNWILNTLDKGHSKKAIEHDEGNNSNKY